MKLKLMLGMLACLGMGNAIAGDKGGNGGGGHLCSNPDGSFKTIEAFDLYEGRDRYTLKIHEWDGHSTKEEIVSEKLALLRQVRPGFARMVQVVIEDLRSPNRYLDKEGKTLSKVLDSHEWYVDNGCEYRQIVNWIEDLDQEVIIRDIKYFKLMNPQSQAAIEIHEAIYKVTRLYKKRFEKIDISDSSKVRKLVAEIFSEGFINSFTLDSKLTELGIIQGRVETTVTVERFGLVRGRSFTIVLPLACPTEKIQISFKHHEDSGAHEILLSGLQYGTQNSEKEILLGKGKDYSTVLKLDSDEFFLSRKNKWGQKKLPAKMTFSVEACGFKKSEEFTEDFSKYHMLYYQWQVHRPLL